MTRTLYVGPCACRRQIGNYDTIRKEKERKGESARSAQRLCSTVYPARRGGGRRRQAGELQLTHIVFSNPASQERRNALIERSVRHVSSPPGAGARCGARQRASAVTITAHQFSASCVHRARRRSRRHSQGRTTARRRRQGACAPCHHRGVGGTAGTFCQSCWSGMENLAF